MREAKSCSFHAYNRATERISGLGQFGRFSHVRDESALLSVASQLLRDFDQHLAEVLALEHAEERGGRVLQALDSATGCCRR
jgi:hypothetical protein